jgi:hypothetical protein
MQNTSPSGASRCSCLAALKPHGLDLELQIFANVLVNYSVAIPGQQQAKLGALNTQQCARDTACSRKFDHPKPAIRDSFGLG